MSFPWDEEHALQLAGMLFRELKHAVHDYPNNTQGDLYRLAERCVDDAICSNDVNSRNLHLINAIVLYMKVIGRYYDENR